MSFFDFRIYDLVLKNLNSSAARRIFFRGCSTGKSPVHTGPEYGSGDMSRPGCDCLRTGHGRGRCTAGTPAEEEVRLPIRGHLRPGLVHQAILRRRGYPGRTIRFRTRNHFKQRRAHESEQLPYPSAGHSRVSAGTNMHIRHRRSDGMKHHSHYSDDGCMFIRTIQSCLGT